MDGMVALRQSRMFRLFPGDLEIGHNRPKRRGRRAQEPPWRNAVSPSRRGSDCRDQAGWWQSPTNVTIALDPRGAAPLFRPQDGEEAFVERGIAGALVATVDVAARTVTELGILWNEVNTDGPAHPIARRIRARPMPDLASVEDARSCRHLDVEGLWGNHTGRLRGGLHLCAIVTLAVERVRQGGERPEMRAWCIFERARVGLSVVERHPAGHGHRWIEGAPVQPWTERTSPFWASYRIMPGSR